MIDVGYDIDTSLKAKSYRKIFPGINGDYAGFKEIKDKLSSSSKKSNIHDLLDYLDNAYQNK